nr:hypothetical protein [Tanacetum cinerariifolium]
GGGWDVKPSGFEGVAVEKEEEKKVCENKRETLCWAQCFKHERDRGDTYQILTEVYYAMVAQEILEYHDGDVIPTKVYEAMVAQEMLEDQTRPIKRRRVMANKEDEDDALGMLLFLLA